MITRELRGCGSPERWGTEKVVVSLRVPLLERNGAGLTGLVENNRPDKDLTGFLSPYVTACSFLIHPRMTYALTEQEQHPAMVST